MPVFAFLKMPCESVTMTMCVYSWFLNHRKTAVTVSSSNFKLDLGFFRKTKQYRCLQDIADPQKEEIHELLNHRDSTGKSPLDLIASLERTELASLVIHNGADVNSCTSKGYSCLHHAAAWGHLPVLKILVDNGINLHRQNIHSETARDVALRYLHQECADFLEISEEKENLQLEITHALKSIQEMDKALIGRITRDEKNRVINTCKGKQEWLNSTPDASAQEIRAQHSELTEIVQPILANLHEPLPEKREIKDK